MRNRFKKAITLATIAVAIAGTAAAETALVEAAPAPNCGLTGKWILTGTLIQLPKNGPDIALSCTITLAANGNYKGKCFGFTPGKPKAPGDASGIIKADANCQLSGTIHSPPNPAPSTISGGAVNGNVATYVAYRGSVNAPTQVRHVTLIRAK